MNDCDRDEVQREFNASGIHAYVIVSRLLQPHLITPYSSLTRVLHDQSAGRSGQPHCPSPQASSRSSLPCYSACKFDVAWAVPVDWSLVLIKRTTHSRLTRALTTHRALDGHHQHHPCQYLALRASSVCLNSIRPRAIAQFVHHGFSASIRRSITLPAPLQLPLLPSQRALVRRLRARQDNHLRRPARSAPSLRAAPSASRRGF